MHHHSRKNFTIFVLILGSLSALAPLSIDMYLPAFSAMAQDFNVDAMKIQLSLSSFLIGLSVGQLFYGSVSDRYGRKKPLYFGLMLFVAASVMCSLSANAEHLIFWRFVQALGMCSGMVISRAMVRDLFDRADAARVFSLLILVMGIAPIIAPLAGGYLATGLGWRAIFWILGGFGLVLFLFITKLLPETRPFDPETKLSNTFCIYLEVLRHREFLRFAMTGGLSLAGLFAYITGAPFIFIDLFGIAPHNFGWVFGTNAIGFITMSQINGRLVRRFDPEIILKYGLIAGAAASGLLLLAGAIGLGIAAIWPCLFLYVSALGFIAPNAMSCAMASQDASRGGSASALAGTMQFAFSSIASALLSLMHPHSALPVTLIVGLCGIGAFFVSRLKNRPAPDQA